MTINVLTNLREHIIIHIRIVAPPMSEARDISSFAYTEPLLDI